MKRKKMGSILSLLNPLEESSDRESEEIGNKHARTSQQTGCATEHRDILNVSVSESEKDDSKTESCQAKRDAAEKEKVGNVSEMTKASRGGFLTGPLIKTKDSLSSHTHQLLNRAAQRHKESHTVPHSRGDPLHDFTISSAALSTTTFFAEPFCPAQIQSKTLSPVAFPAFLSNTPALTMTLSLGLQPTRLYHSTPVSNTTAPLPKESGLSLKEKDAEVDKNTGISHDSVSVQQKTSLVKENLAVDESCGDFHYETSDGYELKLTEVPNTDIGALEEEKGLQSPNQEADCGIDPALDDYNVEKYRRKLKQLPRQWEVTRYGMVHKSHHMHTSRSGRRRPVEFSIMTYNVLAQNLLEDHSDLYTGCRPRWLDWDHRRQLLMAEIACHNPDIMNLQEVNKDHFFDYLQPRLERLGYVGCYQKRTGDKRDGCATLWKQDKFELLHFRPVQYCRGGLLDRDNIAIIVELRPLRSSSKQRRANSAGARQEEDKIVVANTHLLFNPRRGDIKLAQLMILLAEVDKHAYLGPSPEAPLHWPLMSAQSRYCPVILTGDFNMQPQSDLYKFVVGGQMDYEGLLLREMSGQEEGRYGRNLLLGRDFFSPMFGVTESCQYHTAVMDRLTEPHGHQGPPVQPEGGRGKLQRRSRDGRMPGFTRKMVHKTGRLWHHLNLVSAYRHRVERLGQTMEVTTHHNSGKCSVDYVFYSVDSKEVHHQRNEVRLRSIRDGQLKLLARYGLMSEQELDAMGGIPNQILPSDHLCLITKFLLT
ncbi:protein angel homolog 1-like isoform X2 [Babylonia areolata]